MKRRRIPGLVTLVIASGWMASAPLWAISCFSDLGIVRDVKAEHLLNQARSIARRMAELGVPFDGWELEVLDTAFQSPQAPWAVVEIQRVFDAHCLISLSVSAEAEIKAAAGPALAFAPTSGWGIFLIKVDNLGRHGSSLRVESPNVVEPGGVPDAEHWMQFKFWPEDATLSGERVDYFLLRVHSQERGKREALFAFSSGLRPLQSPGPLSYNRHPVLFTWMDASEISRAKLAHLLRHQHGLGYSDARRRKAPPLAAIRTEACLDCHATAKEGQTTQARLEREQSCMACHRELSASAPTSTRCSICGMENCQMGCLTRGRTQSGAQVMLMSGLPRPLFLGGVACVLLLSFVVVEVIGRKGKTKPPAEPQSTERGCVRSPSRSISDRSDSLRLGLRPQPRSEILTPINDAPEEKLQTWRWNFLSLSLPKAWFRRSWIRPVFQVPVFLLFCFLICAGFAGDQAVNITPTLTWTIWWAGLIFLVLFLGKAWCFVCPWEYSATLVQGIGRLWRSRAPLTLGLSWPHALRNIYLAIGLFVLLTWLELGFGVTSSPRATAILGLVMAGLCVVPALIFSKRSFCRYGCMIGRISGLYAMFAPVEVRSADLDVCKQCRTRDCFRGNDAAPACPTSLILPALKANTYCIQCGYCAQSCPSDNVAFNVRPFAADLTRFSRPRTDESILAVILLALTSFHGLTMTPFWDAADGFSIIGWLRSTLGIGQLTAFTMGMLGVMAVPIAFYWLLCGLTRRVAGDEEVSTRKLFLYFAYSLLPIALFYHLAHNAMHFFMEGQFILPLLSDPLGRGWNLFGTAEWRPGPFLAAKSVWGLQVALVLIGHIFGIVIAHHASRKLYADERRAIRALIPILVGMVLYSWFSLWILHLDMNMRSTLL